MRLSADHFVVNASSLFLPPAWVTPIYLPSLILALMSDTFTYFSESPPKYLYCFTSSSLITTLSTDPPSYSVVIVLSIPCGTPLHRSPCFPPLLLALLTST